MIPNMFTPKIAAIAAAVALAAGLFGGWRAHDAMVHRPHLAADARAGVRLAQVSARLTAAAQRLGEARRAQLDARQAEIRTVTRNLIREVPRYVETTVKCTPSDHIAGAGKMFDRPRVALADVSVGFGLLHNYAAAGVDPPATPAAGIDLSAPSGAGMPRVAETILSNYGQCHAAIAEVKAWRAWHRDDFRPWWAQVDAEFGKALRR